jgi:hypothetical protein
MRRGLIARSKPVGWANAPAAAVGLMRGLARVCPRRRTSRIDRVGKIAQVRGENAPSQQAILPTLRVLCEVMA